MYSMTARFIVIALLLCPSPAIARSPEDICEASKNKIAGKYFACREKAEAKSIAKGETVDYGACSTKFDEAWNKAEEKSGATCRDAVLTAPMNVYLAAQAAAAAEIIAGEANVPTCGDDIVNALGELCDGPDLAGYSCTDMNFHSGVLSCSAACDFDMSACVACPGTTHDGACWFLAADNQSCTASCAAHGMTYSSKTETFAGSGGTQAQCGTILGFLEAPGSGNFNSGTCSAALGCISRGIRGGFYDGYRIIGYNWERCTSPSTSATAALADVRRACACQ
jgi:hypothetical protein